MNIRRISYGLIPLLMVACAQHNESREKQPVLVKVEQAGGETMNHEGTAYVGIVEENEATAVSFTSMGTVRRVLVSEGQVVARGQLIAEMDDTQAHNMLMAAEAQNRQAEDALERYRLLHDEGAMTEAQWVEVQSKVEQARSQLAIARKNLSDCRLLAPVSGIVGRRNVSAGETAMPSQAVVTLLDISSVKVKFSVPEGEMKAIAPSTPTTVSVEAIGCEVPGGRIEKGVQADALTHTYDVRVRVGNPDGALLPGMVAKVKLGQYAGKDVHGGIAQTDNRQRMTLPLTVIGRRPDGTLFVWTLGEGNKAHRTAVTIGKTIGNRVEILAGISAGQQVITEGYQKLSEGSLVSITE